MKAIDDGGPAYPSHGTMGEVAHEGASLRDVFAMHALQGLLANPKLAPEILKHGGARGGWIEESAYGWADSMLAVRKKRQS